MDKIFGGRYIAVCSSDFVCFYDWTECRLIRRIDVCPKDVIWSEDGDHVVLTCADNFYVLRHDQDSAQAAVAGNAAVDDGGIGAAFKTLSAISDKVVSGTWVGDCFVYVSQEQRLTCLVAGHQETIALLDRVQHLLGHLPEQSKLFLIDKELNVTQQTLHLAFVKYQSAIMKKDFGRAETFYVQLPESLHNRVARFLKKQGYLSEALQISKDDGHKFELKVPLGKLQMADEDPATSSTSKRVCGVVGGLVVPTRPWGSGGVGCFLSVFGLSLPDQVR